MCRMGLWRAENGVGQDRGPGHSADFYIEVGIQYEN